MHRLFSSSKLWRRLLGVCLLAWSTLSLAQPAPRSCPPTPQEPTQAQIEQATKSARDRGFLWRISKDGRTSYLFGTVHVGRFEWAFPGPRVTQALRASQVIALEIDLLDSGIAQRMQSALASGANSELPPKLAARLKSQLDAACLPAEMAKAMSPEMLVATLAVMSARHEGLDAAWGIDMVYAGVARGMKRPVVSLESPEEQLAALQGRSPEETQKMVEEGLDELEGPQMRSVIRRLARDWAESRFDDLARYEAWCDCARTPAQRESLRRLLDDRNVGLAERIAALHAGGQAVFAAVGSLHMIGPQGLPALMAGRGFKVERVVFGSP